MSNQTLTDKKVVIDKILELNTLYKVKQLEELPLGELVYILRYERFIIIEESEWF